MCVAIIRYFLTTARDGFHRLTTLLAPAVGGLAMVGGCWLLVTDRSTLAAAEDVPFIEMLPWVVLAMFAAGVVIAAVMRRRRPDLYAGLGHFSLAETVEETR